MVLDFIELFATQPMAILLTDHAVRGGAKLSRYVYVLGLAEITAEGPSAACTGDVHEHLKSWHQF